MARKRPRSFCLCPRLHHAKHEEQRAQCCTDRLTIARTASSATHVNATHKTAYVVFPPIVSKDNRCYLLLGIVCYSGRVIALAMRRIILATVLVLALTTGASAQSQGNNGNRRSWGSFFERILQIFDRTPNGGTGKGSSKDGGVVSMPEPSVLSEFVITGAGVGLATVFLRRRKKV